MSWVNLLMKGRRGMFVKMIFKVKPISPVLHREIGRVAKFILSREGFRWGGVDIVFVSKQESKKLNRGFRKKNHPADVLSFPLAEGEKFGEVIVTPEIVSPKDRIIRLIVHGIYHLLGYDHQTDQDYAAMVQRERAAIRSTKRMFVEI